MTTARLGGRRLPRRPHAACGELVRLDELPQPALRVARFGLAAALGALAVTAVALVGEPGWRWAGPGTGLALTAAALRGWRLRADRLGRLAEQPSRAMAAEVWEVTGPADGVTGAGLWLALSSPDHPDRDTTWQRVMWHPVLDAARGPLPVQVRGAPGVPSASGPGALLVEGPGGARLVPVGASVARPPRAVVVARRSRRLDRLEQLAVLPTRTLAAPDRAWWRRGAWLAGAGAAASGAMALLLGADPRVALAVAAWGGAGAVNAWGLAGAEP